MPWKTYDEAIQFWNRPNFAGASEPLEVKCSVCGNSFYMNEEPYEPPSEEYAKEICPWCNEIKETYNGIETTGEYDLVIDRGGRKLDIYRFDGGEAEMGYGGIVIKSISFEQLLKDYIGLI